MSAKLLSHRGALCNMVRRIAVEAGEIILPFYDGVHDLDVSSKSDGSPVTQADKQAEDFITKELLRVMPDITVIGEESAAQDGTPSEPGEYFWLVDPLDGTREFIAGGDDFTVNIALIHKHEPVLGVIYAPAKDELYAGYTKEDGSAKAFRIIAETGREKDMRVRRVPKAGLTVMASSHYRSGGRLDSFLEEYKVEKVIRRASSLKICALAAGKADLYARLGPTGEWDTAAGDAILRAAGGVIKAFETREPLRYGAGGGDFLNPEFVAASGDLF